jgi:nicotinate-nucleotide adenylyltransferase
MKVGLLFGSFNPIHQGHIDIANYFATNTDVQEVWLVVSPQNPFKTKLKLLSPAIRLALVDMALQNEPHLKSCNIELSMPTPSYTIDTMRLLDKQYVNHEFYIIMGTDNLEKIKTWKEYEQILSTFKLMVYPRKGHQGGMYKDHPNIQLANSEFIEISATELREKIKRKENSGMIPEMVWNTIMDEKYYQ